MYEDLIQIALSRVSHIPNHNKPHHAICTAQQYHLPLLEAEKHIATNCALLALRRDNAIWELMVTNQFLAIEKPELRFATIIYFFFLILAPVPHPVPLAELFEVVRHHEAAQKAHLEKVDILLRIAGELTQAAGFPTTLPEVQNFLYNYGLSSYILNITQRGNCGDLCACVATHLLTLTSQQPDFLPVELAMFDMAGDNAHLSHVILIVNRKKSVEEKNIEQRLDKLMALQDKLLSQLRSTSLSNPELQRLSTLQIQRLAELEAALQSHIRNISAYGDEAILVDAYHNTWIYAKDLLASSKLEHQFMKALYVVNTFRTKVWFSTHNLLESLQKIPGGMSKQHFLQWVNNQLPELLARCSLPPGSALHTL